MTAGPPFPAGFLWLQWRASPHWRALPGLSCCTSVGSRRAVFSSCSVCLHSPKWKESRSSPSDSFRPTDYTYSPGTLQARIWSGVAFPSLEVSHDPGISQGLLHCLRRFLPAEPPGGPRMLGAQPVPSPGSSRPRNQTRSSCITAVLYQLSCGEAWHGIFQDWGPNCVPPALEG